MANKGGENPYDVEYSKDKESNIMDSQKGDDMADNTSVGSKAFQF